MTHRAYSRTRARRRTVQQQFRQERVFELSVLGGRSIRQIATLLGLAPGTVLRDLRAEQERRATELANAHPDYLVRHLALIDDLFARSMALRSVRGTGALTTAAKALELRAQVLGLGEPTKVERGLDALVKALDGACT